MEEFREVAAGGIRLHVTEDLPADWAVGLWREVRSLPTPETLEWPLPPVMAGLTARVRLLPAPAPLRVHLRLRRGRASREGRGHAEFAARGVTIPRMLMWGERRPLGLLGSGIVVTVKIFAPTVAQAYRESGEEEVLAAAMEELAHAHRAGLRHGDPLARRFLATRPRVTVCDLAAWGSIRPAGRAEDLARFLASARGLAGDRSVADRLLDRYQRTLGEMPVAREEVLARVESLLSEPPDQPPG